MFKYIHRKAQSFAYLREVNMLQSIARHQATQLLLDAMTALRMHFVIPITLGLISLGQMASSKQVSAMPVLGLLAAAGSALVLVGLVFRNNEPDPALHYDEFSSE